MSLPTIHVLVPVLAADVVVGEGSAITLGLALGLAVFGIAWGEARMQISGLREWRKTVEAEQGALLIRVGALEVREGRTTERIDHLTNQLARIEAKLDKLLELRASA
jgi:hypothetical protein